MYLQQFAFEGTSVRVAMVDGAPHWIAADVCRVLEIGNPSDVIGRLDEDETTLVSIEGGPPAGLNAVTEPGLYSLILGSRKPQAKAFKRWVIHEVLPAIRQTGAYSIKKPETIREWAEAYIELDKEREKLAGENAALAVTASAHEALTSSAGCCSVADAGKVLGFGERKFFEQLRKDKILQSTFQHKNVPYQIYIDQGFFIVKDRTFQVGDVPPITCRSFPAAIPVGPGALC